MRISFLEGTQPLTKTVLRAKDGTISKNPYPLVATFTSHSYEIKSLVELYGLITAHAARGHCLLKGSLQRELQHERRRGSTNGSTPTQWVCLDFDAVETPNLDDTLETMGIGSTDYIVQYSSSHGLDPELEGTVSAHVFMLLSEPIPPATLKSWLMEINFKLFDEQLELNASHMALRWPLDITTCQNDKLLYISPPNFKNMPDPVADRIQYVKKTSRTLDVQRIGTKPLEAMKSEARAKVNMLRTALGLTAIRKTVNKGEYEVQSSPDACVVTGVRKDSDFTRLNINGGDSWAYWHPNDNWELIHDYKTGLSYPTAKFIPDYYQELEQQREIALETPTADGDLVLGFVDLPTGSYFKGLWNEEKQRLSLYPARDRTQVCDWYMSHGLTPPDFIPQWRIYFDPRSDKILDTEDMTINTYRRSPLYEVTGNKDAQFPHIKSIVMHMLGGDDKVYEHFINWFACIFQRKHKPLTAWVVHGCEGCLSGDTIVTYARGSRTHGRPLTIKEAYEKFNGLWKATGRNGKNWEPGLITRCRSVKDNMTVGFHEIMRIVESGEQQLYKLTDEHGNTIRATWEHPFMRPDGTFTKLCDLKPGDEIIRRGDKNAHARNPRDRNKARVTIHSIPFHPTATKHIINGKNYKRAHRARLMFEANMNGLTLDEFVEILRTDEPRAKRLQYLSSDVVVHHLDEDPSNDEISNLATVDKLDHDKHHAKETGLGKVLTKIVHVKSIVKDKVEMTYDMTMKAPYHNYEANGFIVSNTGKGYFYKNIVRPLLEPSNTFMVMANDIEDNFNGWIESKNFIFVDEVDVDDFKEKGRVTAKLRNYITEPKVSIRKMRAQAAEYDNWTAWLFGSNKKQPVYIPATDRRYNVGNFQNSKLPRPDDDVVAAELENFARYLKAHKADPKLADSIIFTEDRERIAALAVTSVDETSSMILSGDLEKLWEMKPDDHMLGISPIAMQYRNLIERLRTKKPPYLTRDEMWVIFEYTVGKIPASPGRFGAYLRHQGIVLQGARFPVRWKEA